MKKSIQLPLNCATEYVEEFLSREESRNLYTLLISDYDIANVKMKLLVDEKVTYIDTRKIMFMNEDIYADTKFPELIWGKTAVWSDELKKLKKKVEAFTGIKFGICVCIYYPDGNSGVAYHSDFTAFGDTTVIPSISLGTERIFCLREKESLEVYEMMLKDGSMLIMGENCQERYEHSLPTNSVYTKGRINLTFRQYGFKHQDS